jgi:hypothetical protein
MPRPRRTKKDRVLLLKCARSNPDRSFTEILNIARNVHGLEVSRGWAYSVIKSDNPNRIPCKPGRKSRTERPAQIAFQHNLNTLLSVIAQENTDSTIVVASCTLTRAPSLAPKAWTAVVINLGRISDAFAALLPSDPSSGRLHPRDHCASLFEQFIDRSLPLSDQFKPEAWIIAPRRIASVLRFWFRRKYIHPSEGRKFIITRWREVPEWTQSLKRLTDNFTRCAWLASQAPRISAQNLDEKFSFEFRRRIIDSIGKCDLQAPPTTS